MVSVLSLLFVLIVIVAAVVFSRRECYWSLGILVVVPVAFVVYSSWCCIYC
jgi:hypothetical protein